MLKNFLHDCKRVFQVARKPDKTEYLEVSRVTGIGILIVGVIGFIITIISFLVGGAAPTV